MPGISLAKTTKSRASLLPRYAYALFLLETIIMYIVINDSA